MVTIPNPRISVCLSVTGGRGDSMCGSCDSSEEEDEETELGRAPNPMAFGAELELAPWRIAVAPKQPSIIGTLGST